MRSSSPAVAPAAPRRAWGAWAALAPALLALLVASIAFAQTKGGGPPGGADFGTPPGGKGSSSAPAAPPSKSSPAPPAAAPTPSPMVAQVGDDRSRVFGASSDRVWTVVRSTLLSLGWKVDKEDRDVGWILTKSRGVTGEDFGVYAKGTKHRLRVLVKPRDGRTEVSVERRLWKEERILFVDKEEDIATSDRTVERELLDAIARHL
jgi:hypothetical protein